MSNHTIKWTPKWIRQEDPHCCVRGITFPRAHLTWWYQRPKEIGYGFPNYQHSLINILYSLIVHSVYAAIIATASLQNEKLYRLQRLTALSVQGSRTSGSCFFYFIWDWWFADDEGFGFFVSHHHHHHHRRPSAPHTNTTSQINIHPYGIRLNCNPIQFQRFHLVVNGHT